MNVRAKAVLLAAAALAMSGITGTAHAAGLGNRTCSGGEIASGTYNNLKVTGACTVPAGANITIRRNLTVAPGAVFDAQGAPSNVRIDGNVLAKRGSLFGLGCTAAHGCEGGSTFSNDSVGGNVILDHVFNAAINGVEIGGNVISTGGGGGFVFPNGFIPFSVKDDVIHGNLVVQGLKTTWFGVIRSTIDGNVILLNIKNDDPDGNEVVANTIGKNLACFGLDPAPQFGDAVDPSQPGYGPNTVGGYVFGQCKPLVASSNS